MNQLQRTTVTLPDDLLQWAKISAARYRLSVSDLARRGMEELRREPDKILKESGKNQAGGWRSVVGSLNLGGKEPYKHRSDLYEEHLRRKFSSR